MQCVNWVADFRPLRIEVNSGNIRRCGRCLCHEACGLAQGSLCRHHSLQITLPADSSATLILSREEPKESGGQTSRVGLASSQKPRGTDFGGQTSRVGFEPTRAVPNGFQVHRLNLSANVTSITIYGMKFGA